MAEHNFNEIEASWDLMTPMESALWVTTLALHVEESDGGLGAADQALSKLRRLSGTRTRRPNLEDEAAEANVYLTYEEFEPWYTVAHRIRNHRDPAYKPPTADQVNDAYKHYLLSRDCFY